MEPCVRFEHVSVSFGETSALDDVSVELPRGKIIGLLGPSGAGKTTLMRLIIGRQQLDRGTVRVLGLPPGSSNLRMHLGYMPQTTALYPDLTLLENLRYFAVMRSASHKAVQEILADVDLVAHARQMVGTLSGGQKSRASLAVALLGNPKLLILDEPTVGVDPVLRAKLWEQFHRLASGGTTLLISSHVMDEAGHCDDLILIRDGKLLAHGSPSALSDRTATETIEEAFLSLVGES